MLDSPFNIVLIGVCVIAVLYLIYRMFFDKPITTPQITTKAASYDAAAVQQGLTAAGVNTSQENFEATTNSTTLVLDTTDKFNKNFTYYMTTFIKMINMDNVNKYIEGNGINKTTKLIETEKNINFFNKFSKILDIIGDVVYISGTPTDKILLGLATIIGWNIGLKIDNYTAYYMNDFETVGEMYIYLIPASYTGDRTQLNTDTNILSYAERTIQLGESIKMPLLKTVEQNIINKIINTTTSNPVGSGTTTAVPEITNSSPIFIEYKNKILRNKTAYITIAELYIACLYCYYDNPTAFTFNSQIITVFTNYMNTLSVDFKPANVTLTNISMYNNIRSQLDLSESVNDPPQNAPPQNASPQNASPQNASPQNASPQNASPQNASPQNAPPQTQIFASNLQSTEVANYTGDYITLYTQANNLGTSMMYKLDNVPLKTSNSYLAIVNGIGAEKINSFTITNRSGTTYNIYGIYLGSDYITRNNVLLQAPFNNIPQTAQLTNASGAQVSGTLSYILINNFS
jgi:hypothetical protein